MRVHLIAFAATAACGGRSEPHAATTTVALGAPGQAPLRALRYQPHPGERDVRMHFEVMTFVASVQLESIDPVRYRFRGTRLEADPKIFDKTIEDAVTHVSGAIAGDTRGRAAASTDSSVYHTMPEFAPQFEQTIVPLPEEPVGVGARWHTSGQVWSAETHPTIELDYELTALTATEATVHAHGVTKDANGKATIDATTTIRFDDLIPLRARISYEMSLPDIPNMRPLVITLD